MLFSSTIPMSRLGARCIGGMLSVRICCTGKSCPSRCFPISPMKNDKGCFSGSAVERDGVLYLFYTAVSKQLGQTQCIAVSRDGKAFEKYKGNPVIAAPPAEGSYDFRDPKVVELDGKTYMVCGSGKDGVGKILLYEQGKDLFTWQYVGVLFESSEYGKVLGVSGSRLSWEIPMC